MSVTQELRQVYHSMFSTVPFIYILRFYNLLASKQEIGQVVLKDIAIIDIEKYQVRVWEWLVWKGSPTNAYGKDIVKNVLWYPRVLIEDPHQCFMKAVQNF